MIPDYSESGAPIYHHELHQRHYELTPNDHETHQLIRRHAESHVGKISSVFQETISDLVHVDVLIIDPEENRDYYTLVTTGMSDRAMKVPEHCEMFAHAELMLRLPTDWPMSEDAFREERNYWPIRWLRILARFPHEYQTWLFEGHTIPNQDPPEPFADNTELSGMLLTRPTSFDREIPHLEINPEKTVGTLM